MVNHHCQYIRKTNFRPEWWLGTWCTELSVTRDRFDAILFSSTESLQILYRVHMWNVVTRGSCEAHVRHACCTQTHYTLYLASTVCTVCSAYQYCMPVLYVLHTAVLLDITCVSALPVFMAVWSVPLPACHLWQYQWMEYPRQVTTAPSYTLGHVFHSVSVCLWAFFMYQETIIPSAVYFLLTAFM